MDRGIDTPEWSARHRWHDAAERAAFTFFEPVAPDRTSVWAGGFGWSARGPDHLAVHALVAGTEVVVDTRRLPPPQVGDDARKRLIVIDLVDEFLLHEPSELQLPLSIKVVADDRTILVVGRVLNFTGLSVVAGSRWTGEVVHDGLVIRVTTATDAPEFSIEPCRTWRSLPELRPADR